MKNIDQLIKELIIRRTQGKSQITLLAVCPNSLAVLEAAVRAAARHNSVMLFAATLNQVDYESSYTGWTPAEFVLHMQGFARKYCWSGALYPCLDHGGPWLKDLHSLARLTYTETMDKVKQSITACILAGYKLLHIDPTVDRTIPTNQVLPVEIVVDRTVELIEHAERIRVASGIPQIGYEVGTEEVHGGLVDFEKFECFISLLRAELTGKSLAHIWPCLFVAQIGTNLHTTIFNPEIAKRLNSILAPTGSLVKGHYTDWVDNPEQYPLTGMGAANVGPEFTAEEFIALAELEAEEKATKTESGETRSNFMAVLERAVVDSGRWKKWLLPDEAGLDFQQLSNTRKEWLLKTGSRYIWTDKDVVFARNLLYRNLESHGFDADNRVVEKITKVIEKYMLAFNLANSVDIFGE